MISFRARPEQGIDWTTITIDGDDEDLLAHAVGARLVECNWEILLPQRVGGDSELDDWWNS